MDVVCNHLLIALKAPSVVCLQGLTGQEAQAHSLLSSIAAARLPQTVASLAPAPAETRRAAAAALTTASSAAWTPRWTPPTAAIRCPASGQEMVCSPPSS